MAYAWRPMQQGDLPQVMAIAAVVHAGYFESEAVFAQRLDVFPAGCWIASDALGAIGGYMVMHPARLGYPPALNTLLPPALEGMDCLHLHDIALLPATRGAGLGQGAVALLGQVMEAQQLPCATLVAVHASAPYWMRFGFVDVPNMPDMLATQLASYGEDARYMGVGAVSIGVGKS